MRIRPGSGTEVSVDSGDTLKFVRVVDSGEGLSPYPEETEVRVYGVHIAWVRSFTGYTTVEGEPTAHIELHLTPGTRLEIS